MEEPALNVPSIHGAGKITVDKWVNFDYASHADARDHFRQLGCIDIDVLPDHGPCDFVAELKPLLVAATNLKMVVDLTSKCPTTSSGTLLPWIKTLQSAKNKSNEHNDVVFVACRTEENTTAFVHTLGYGGALEAQSRDVDPKVHNPFANQAVAAIIFFRDRELCLPARVGCGSAAVAADAVATMLGVGHHGFACGICNATFVKWTINQITGNWQQSIDNFLLTECDHLFHAHCVVERVQIGRGDSGTCPWCDTRLPWSVVPANEPQPTQNERCHLIGTVDMSEAQGAAFRWTQAARVASSQRAAFNQQVLARLPNVTAQLQPL